MACFHGAGDGAAPQQWREARARWRGRRRRRQGEGAEQRGEAADHEAGPIPEPSEPAVEAAAEAAAQEDKFRRLQDWLLSEGDASAFPAIYMRKYEPFSGAGAVAEDGGGNECQRGVHARCDIDLDEVVLRIGRQFLVTVETARASAVGRQMQQAIDAGRLDLSASRHCVLSVFMLWDQFANPVPSFFQPFYDVLPRLEDMGNMPLFWRTEELAFLRGSFLEQQVSERWDNIRLDFEQIVDTLPSVRPYCTLPRFAWARMLVASRNFGITIEGRRTDAMVPYADMLNHYRPRQTRWAYDDAVAGFVIHAVTPLHVGQQIYDSYGKKCNSRFLLNYGFAVEDNRDAETGQDHNEVRRAGECARVALFLFLLQDVRF